MMRSGSRAFCVHGEIKGLSHPEKFGSCHFSPPFVDCSSWYREFPRSIWNARNQLRVCENPSTWVHMKVAAP